MKSFWRAWFTWVSLVSLGSICIGLCKGGEIPTLADAVSRHSPAVAHAFDDATPEDAIWAALELLPEPEKAFGDVGVGDGRVLIAAWRKWGKPVIGYEIDPVRASEAYDACKDADVGEFRIVVIDATKLESVEADVLFCYQFPDLLEELAPLLKSARAFATYAHAVPGVPMDAGPKRTFVWSAVNAADPVKPAAESAEVAAAVAETSVSIDFYYADWCGACKQMYDDIRELEGEGINVNWIDASNMGISLPRTVLPDGRYFTGAVTASDIRRYLPNRSGASDSTSQQTEYWATYGGKQYSASAWGDHALSCRCDMCDSLIAQWRAAGWPH